MILVVGGGGGKLKNTDAVLIVTVPTGSTCTATKGGTTLTPTMWVKAEDQTLDCAIFSIPASQFDSTTPWTITATDGTNTASGTVLITANKEYEISLSYFPQGYTKLTYIEATGTQYLSLPFNNVNFCGINMVADFTFRNRSGEQCFFSANTSYPCFLYVNSSGHLYSMTNYTNGGGWGDYDDALLDVRTTFNYLGSSSSVVVQKNGDTWASRDNLSAITMSKADIFRKQNGTYYMKARLHGLTIWDTDHTTKLYELYPARRNSDSAVGMLDVLTETLYTNQGSGTFIAGEDA